VFLLVALVVSASAQSPAGMRLYAFSSGALTVPKSFLQANGPSTMIQVPVGFFVVRHPKGNVLFDTGNNDRIITDPGYWGDVFIKAINPVRTPDVAIDAQLGKIGIKPDDIKFVVVSHMHLDHGGNIAKFPKSTLIVQRDEVRNAFWPEPGTAGNYIPGDFMMLRSDPPSPIGNKWPMIQLTGDLDVFNDGSLVVKRWVGHTPGSQMMIVRLPKTGTVVLTGDNVYFAENLTKNLLPDVSLAYNPSGILSGYQWIREMQARENAQYFTAHDPDGFKQMKKAPDFLE
jgi:glyoxylase-like metal-dependent hydrolase (beta-lactamase superfamily II)